MQVEIQKTIHLAVKHPHRRNLTNSVEEFKILKSCYGRLWFISVQINERFNWFICAVLIDCLFMVITGSYWTLIRIMFQQWKTLWRKLKRKIQIRSMERRFSFYLFFILDSIVLHYPLPFAIIVLVHEVECWRSVSKQIAKSIFVTKNFSSELGRKVS